MNRCKIPLAVFAALALTLTGCADTSTEMDETAPAGTTEAELNAPVDHTDGLTPETSADGPEAYSRDLGVLETQPYSFPTYSTSFGITKTIYERAKRYYDQNWRSFSNRRYVVLIDMGLHSGKKRFVLFDLQTGTVSKHNTSHGVGSDSNNDGIATSFSNVEGSKKTSLGFYKTLYTYNGSNGRSLRLEGLEASNNNALERAIVVHGANYISDRNSTAGRSWGCPALDHAVVQSVIDKIKGGAMMLIATSR